MANKEDAARQEINQWLNQELTATAKRLHDAFNHPDFLRGRRDALKGKSLPKKADSTYKNGHDVGCGDRLRCQNRIKELEEKIPKLRKELAELQKLIGKK